MLDKHELKLNLASENLTFFIESKIFVVNNLTMNRCIGPQQIQFPDKM